MLDIGRYLANTDLTYGKDGKCTSTKGDYFMIVKVALKEKFPDHEAWKTESSWIDALKSDIEKGANQANLLSTEFFDSKVVPFYPEVKDEYIRMKHHEVILHGDTKYAIDLRSLCCLLMKKASGKADLQVVHLSNEPGLL